MAACGGVSTATGTGVIDGNTAAERARDDWHAEMAFTNWRIAREQQLRTDTGAILDALTERQIHEIAGDLLAVGMTEREPDESTPDFRHRIASDLWCKSTKVIEWILESEARKGAWAE